MTVITDHPDTAWTDEANAAQGFFRAPNDVANHDPAVWVPADSSELPPGSQAAGYFLWPGGQVTHNVGDPRTMFTGANEFWIDNNSAFTGNDYYIKFWMMIEDDDSLVNNQGTGMRWLGSNGWFTYLKFNDGSLDGSGSLPSLGSVDPWRDGYSRGMNLQYQPTFMHGDQHSIAGMGTSTGNNVPNALRFGQWYEIILHMNTTADASPGGAEIFVNGVRTHTSISVAADDYSASVNITPSVQMERSGTISVGTCGVRICGPVKSWDDTATVITPSVATFAKDNDWAHAAFIHHHTDNPGATQNTMNRIVPMSSTFNPGEYWFYNDPSGIMTASMFQIGQHANNRDPVRVKFENGGAAGSGDMTSQLDLDPLPFNTNGWSTVCVHNIVWKSGSTITIKYGKVSGPTFVVDPGTGVLEFTTPAVNETIATLSSTERYSFNLHIHESGALHWSLLKRHPGSNAGPLTTSGVLSSVDITTVAGPIQILVTVGAGSTAANPTEVGEVTVWRWMMALGTSSLMSSWNISLPSGSGIYMPYFSNTGLMEPNSHVGYAAAIPNAEYHGVRAATELNTKNSIGKIMFWDTYGESGGWLGPVAGNTGSFIDDYFTGMSEARGIMWVIIDGGVVNDISNGKSGTDLTDHIRTVLSQSEEVGNGVVMTSIIERKQAAFSVPTAAKETAGIEFNIELRKIMHDYLGENIYFADVSKIVEDVLGGYEVALDGGISILKPAPNVHFEINNGNSLVTYIMWKLLDLDETSVHRLYAKPETFGARIHRDHKK